MWKILLCLLLLGQTCIFAEELLSTEFAFTCSYLPLDLIRIPSPSTESFGIKGDFALYFFKYFFIGGDLSVRFFFRDATTGTLAINGVPFFTDYSFKFGVKYNTIEIGFIHHCDHPVLSNGMINSVVQRGGYEEFYIKFSGKIGILESKSNYPVTQEEGALQ